MLFIEEMYLIDRFQVCYTSYLAVRNELLTFSFRVNDLPNDIWSMWFMGTVGCEEQVQPTLDLTG